MASVRGMLETQRTYLGLLFDDQARHFDVLVQVGTTYGELQGTGEAFLRFINERVLWTRNAEPIGWSDLAAAGDAAAWLLYPSRWAALTSTLANDAWRAPWPYAPVLALLIATPVFWRRSRAALTACGQQAAAGTATRYSPTVRGLLLTVAIAVPAPAFVWLLARRVAEASGDSEFMLAVGAGLATVAVTFFPLELLRQSSRPQGLMAAHFRWSSRAVAVLRGHLRWFAAAALPCAFVLAALASQEDQARHHALGRLALVGLQVASAVFLARVLHPARGVFGGFFATHRGDWPERLRNVWHGAAVCIPLSLAGVALSGYMYAAGELVAKSLETVWLAVAVVIAYGMVSRWVLVSRRTLAPAMGWSPTVADTCRKWSTPVSSTSRSRQRIQRGRDDIRVMVRYPRDDRRSLGNLEDMRIRTPNGGEVPFHHVAEVQSGRGFASIKRVDRNWAVNVTAAVDPTVTSPPAVIADLESRILPEVLAGYPGVFYTFEGAQAEEAETVGGLQQGFLLAVLMIFALLAIPLRSYVQPMIIMAAIPFGLVGAIWGHVVMGLDVTMMSMFGLVALTGVVVNDSLVMVDFINRARKVHADVGRKVRQAGGQQRATAAPSSRPAFSSPSERRGATGSAPSCSRR